MTPSLAQEPPAHVPPEARFAHRFSLFNAVNFQILLGSPTIIYAKSLGASSTTVGIVAALAPLLTVLQLPTAYFIPKVGFKRFVLFGWLSRTVIGVIFAATPLIPAFDATTKTSVMLMSLFLYNVLRGVSTGAWLPWLTALVPEVDRGEFLRRDQLHVQLGGIVAMALSTLVLWSGAQPWRFTLLFLLSAGAGTLSLSYIRRIPDVEIGEGVRTSGQPVPWLAILRYPPFAKLLTFNVVYNWVIGGLGAFTIGFLQTRAGFAAGQILGCALLSFIGAFLSLPLFGPVLGRTGSKPILRVAMGLQLGAILAWLCISGSFVAPTALTVATVYFVNGFAAALFAVANVKITMDTMPLMGRNHFFSLFTVFTSSSLGLAPICWGVFLDLIGKNERFIGPFQLTRYSLYFLLLAGLVGATFVLANPLMEKRGQPISLALRDAVIVARLRLYGRFFNR